jgi:hypothetical protein
VNGHQSAVHAQGFAQLLQGGIGAGGHQVLQPAAAGRIEQGLAAATVILRSDITQALPLAEQLFDHPDGDIKASCYLIAGAVLPVVGFQDALAQIKREGLHDPNLPPNPNGYNII